MHNEQVDGAKNESIQRPEHFAQAGREEFGYTDAQLKEILAHKGSESVYFPGFVGSLKVLKQSPDKDDE
jgi:hypothetical protein